MYETFELRWFFGEPPIGFDAWDGPWEERTDHYAPMASPRSSVKLREGNLEVKFLLDELRPADAGRFDGLWQRWIKHSFELPPEAQAAVSPPACEHWLPVEKRRCVKFFRIDDRQLTNCVESPDDCLQVEWTEVASGEHRAWTFGLETPAQHRPQVLASMLELLADEYGFHPAEFPSPQSYPAWICELLKRFGSETLLPSES